MMVSMTASLVSVMEDGVWLDGRGMIGYFTNASTTPPSAGVSVRSRSTGDSNEREAFGSRQSDQTEVGQPRSM